MAAEHAQIVMAKSDSGLHIALHPLVLLTISDYVTRHTLRHFKQPIVGALLGQQNGRETTVEHAFECKVMSSDDALLDAEWFETRLQLSRLHNYYEVLVLTSSSEGCSQGASA